MKSVALELVLTSTLDRFSKLIVNRVADDKEWISIRETKNYQDDHGVTDVGSVDLRCFQLNSKRAAFTATVAAGGTLGFIADQGVDHPGPVQFYMAKVPAGTTVDVWGGSGNVWFKVAYLGDSITSKGVNWPTYSTHFFGSLTVALLTLCLLSPHIRQERIFQDPREHSQRRLSCPCREYCSASGAAGWWSSILPLLRPDQRYRRWK